MTRTICALLVMGLIVALSISRPAEAWVAYRSYGAGAYHSAYGGSAYGVMGQVRLRAYGGSASWSHGSGSATGAYGGSASWSHGSGSVSGAHGGSASWSRLRPHGKNRLPQEGQGQ